MWPSGRADFSESEGPEFESSSRQRRRSSLISIEHAELLVLAVPGYSNHGIACALRLGSTRPVTDFLG